MRKLIIAFALIVLLLGCTAPTANNAASNAGGQGTSVQGQPEDNNKGTGQNAAPQQPPANNEQSQGPATQPPAEEVSAEDVASDLSSVLNDLGDLRKDLEK